MPPRVTAYDLAAALPALYESHAEQLIRRRLGDKRVDALWREVQAIEEAVMSVPARNLADAIVQVFVLRAQCDEPKNEGAYLTLTSVLRALLPMCSLDFAGLVSIYAGDGSLGGVQ
ncbi:hypothetical protein [Acidocella sp.]|uniref:hypothetical protein n=1 Tax=Acidocella sp. TaxID=50710 RepID=UPI00261EB3E5|nr:hypothetical protein [Acidocella sp.]